MDHYNCCGFGAGLAGTEGSTSFHSRLNDKFSDDSMRNSERERTGCGRFPLESGTINATARHIKDRLQVLVTAARNTFIPVFEDEGR